VGGAWCGGDGRISRIIEQLKTVYYRNDEGPHRQLLSVLCDGSSTREMSFHLGNDYFRALARGARAEEDQNPVIIMTY
jgi:hypothetical protein